MQEAVLLLDGGGEAFPRMLEAIAAAKLRIHLEVYTFSDQGVGREFMDALGGAARRGVDVNVIIDGWGSSVSGRGGGSPVQGGGVKFDIFHPLRTLFVGRFRRNHRKILVIDDEVAYISGINIGDEYQNTAEH